MNPHLKCARQSRLWPGRACYSPTASAHKWRTAFSFFQEIWAINTSVDGKLWGPGEWHPYIYFWAHFTPGSVDIPIEDHVFCMIVCVYVHWCNSILNHLLFTWVKASLVILRGELPWSRRQLLWLKTLWLLGHLLFASVSTKALQGYWQRIVENQEFLLSGTVSGKA